MTTRHPTRSDFLAHGWSDTAAAELDAIARDLERREAIRDDEHADYLADLSAYLRGEAEDGIECIGCTVRAHFQRRGNET